MPTSSVLEHPQDAFETGSRVNSRTPSFWRRIRVFKQIPDDSPLGVGKTQLFGVAPQLGNRRAKEAQHRQLAELAARGFARSAGVSANLIRELANYEKMAPPPVSQDDLAKFYPDLIDAYDRIRALNADTLKAAQSIANEIRRLEDKRKSQ